MSQTILATGNEAVGYGALHSGCKYFFGYPITPQNAIPEFMSREMPKAGGSYVQAECETAAINMVFGASASGARSMTSTSSPGIALMGEGLSGLSSAELPAVVVDVVRMGPGWGTVQQGQTDYRLLTKGGGNGGYNCISLAPASVQEVFDYMQWAFYLADKYRMIVYVVSDYILGEMAERLELKTLEFDPLPHKDWAVGGKGNNGGKHNTIFPSLGADPVGGVPGYHIHQNKKYKMVEQNEIRYQTYMTEDAEVVLVAYGSSARIAHEVMKWLRAEGVKVGLFRLISLWPFPVETIRTLADRVGKFIAVEDSQGQMVDDVDYAVQGKAPVELVGVWARDVVTPSGVLTPDNVYEEVKKFI
jgi:2-oxoglutarate ferredoxin oxidoreductase subunit alpha